MKIFKEEPEDKWNKRVAYFFDETIGTYNYANGHPMKPLRVAMTDTLVRSYEMDKKMNKFVSSKYQPQRDTNNSFGNFFGFYQCTHIFVIA